MTLAELCDMSGNYIGQIEMGRRIPSFNRIEKIAAVLEVPVHELFLDETAGASKIKKLKTDDYLNKMPAYIKRELISKLTAVIKKDIADSLNL